MQGARWMGGVVLSAGLSSVMAAGPADTGLVLHLPLDGSVEPAVGKELGPPQVTGRPVFVQGRHGQAIRLADGVHLLLKLPPSVTAGEFTIALWMKPLWHVKDNLPHPIFEIPADPKSYDQVAWSATQLLFSKGWSEAIAPNGMYGVGDGGVAALHLAPGRWTHVALVHSARGRWSASYFDGEGSRSPWRSDRKLDFYQRQMWLGSRAGGHGSADVELDDLRIYDRAVEATEIPAVAGAAFPPPRDYTQVGARVDLHKAVATPHAVLAKPFFGGRLRVLFVCEAVRAREVIELAQRLDIEPAVVAGPAFHARSLANPEAFVALGRQVEAALKADRVDVVALCSFGWNLFDATTREAIMAYVRAGGGLLLAPPRCIGAPGRGISTNLGPYWVGWSATPLGAEIDPLVGRLDRAAEDWLVAGTPWHELRVFDVHLARQPPASLFRGAQVGQGRVLLYDLHSDASCQTALTPDIAYIGPFDPFDYEYALAVAAKALVWAAGREGQVHLGPVRWATPLFLRKPVIGLAGAWEVEVTNRSAQPVTAQITLAVRNRDPDAPATAQRQATLKPGLTRLQVPYTLDRLGTVFADVRLVREQKVADWATGTIRVEPGNPTIRSLAADREYYETGQTPRITAGVIYRDYGLQPAEPGVLQWRLYDAYDRLVGQGQQPAPFDPADDVPAVITWRLPALERYSRQYRLLVDALKDGRLGDRRPLVLRCREGDLDDFVWFSWGGGHTVPGALAVRRLRDEYGLASVGVQVVGRPADATLRADLDWTASLNLRPWVHAIALGGRPDKDYIRRPDLADRAYWEGQQAKLKEVAAMARAYSPLFYSLGDESVPGPPDAEPSAHEHALFRDFLKERYGTVEAFNAACQTAFAAWEAVVVPSSKDMKAGRASGQWLAELASFRHTLFARAIGGCVDAVRSVDPHAKVGIEGIFGLGHAWGAFDYSKVTPVSTFMGQYALDHELDMVRSFQKPGDLLGCWYNYDLLDPGYSRYGPWHTLLRGLRAFGWFTTYSADQYTALCPDFTPFEHFQWTWEELEPILAGVGKLLAGLERDDVRLRVLYEHRNLHRTSPQYHGMLVMTTLLEDLGLACDWIAADQVAAGALIDQRVQVLILAGQAVMRPDVARAIRAYVEAGGLVVTDILPGAVDDRGTRGQAGLLDAIFAPAGRLTAPLPPRAEADLAAWPAHRLTVGKGRTLAFGRYAESYLRERAKPAGRLLRQVVADFLSAHGVRPAFAVRPVDGVFHPITVRCFRDGADRYVGLQRDYRVPDPSAAALEVAGPAQSHVYDVRAGRYLGQADRVPISLEAARGTLLAFLPYRARGLAVSGLPEAARLGDRLTVGLKLDVEGRPPASGVFRVVVRDPAGARVAALSSKVRSRAGQAEAVLAFAWNDPVGRWTVEIADVATGTRVQQAVDVVPIPAQ